MSVNIIPQLSHRLINFIFGLVLFLGVIVSGVVFYKGDNIAKSTVGLIAQQIPTYDVLRQLNNSLIEKELFLYELYATEQRDEFDFGYNQANQQIQNAFDELIVRFGDISPLLQAQDSLQKLNVVAENFISNISSTETDWIIARQQLHNISKVRRDTLPQIQQLIVLTENEASESQRAILSGFELVRIFVVLYGLATLIAAYIIANATKVYLSTALHNQRLSLFTTRNPNPVISLDIQNKVTYFNPATESLLNSLGYPTDKPELLLSKDLVEYQKKLPLEVISDSIKFEYQIEQTYLECDLHWPQPLGRRSLPPCCTSLGNPDRWFWYRYSEKC